MRARAKDTMPHVEATWERDFEDTKVAIYVGEKEELAQHSRRKPAWCLSEIEKRKTQEILRQIKSMPQVSDIRVVIVTGSTYPTDRRETLAMGADAYFVKPYHLHEFMELGAVIKHLVFGTPPLIHSEQLAFCHTPGQARSGMPFLSVAQRLQYRRSSRG